MLITSADALPVFREVMRVRETLNAYCLSSDKVPVSLDDVEYAVTQEYGAEIEKKMLPFKSDLVRGLIRIWDAREHGFKLYAQTVIDSELNSAQTRYVQTKELCHIILHCADNCTPDPTCIIEYFVQDGMRVINGDGDPIDAKNEKLADVAAYELLFPHDLRSAAKARIAANEDSIFGVADWLDIPEHVVEAVLADRYIHFADHVWSKLR